MSNRRSLLKIVSISSVVGAAWQKPIVSSVILPSHALTSNPTSGLCAVGSNAISQGLSGTDPARNGQLQLIGVNQLSGRSIAARNDDISLCGSGLDVPFFNHTKRS